MSKPQIDLSVLASLGLTQGQSLQQPSLQQVMEQVTRSNLQTVIAKLSEGLDSPNRIEAKLRANAQQLTELADLVHEVIAASDGAEPDGDEMMHEHKDMGDGKDGKHKHGSKEEMSGDAHAAAHKK